MYLFRLLSNKDFPEDGLIASNPNGNVSLDDHVIYDIPSKLSSQFITTVATYDSAYALAKHSPTDDVRIAQINVLDLLNDSDVEFIDLSTHEGRSRFLDSQKAKNFAMKYDIVLIRGKIPASSVTMYYEGPKKKLPEPEIEREDDLSF